MPEKVETEEIVRSLVEFYHPAKIYLFGSAARGEAGPDSDIDFLVVLPDDAPRGMEFSREIHHLLWDVPASIDVIPWRRSDFEARLGWRASLPSTVVREGKLVYAADAVPAG